MSKLPKFEDDNLLVGLETSDDAAIYKISDEVALIQTTDFFTPVVDDPYMFGQIAAANALSDAYAMGGEPKIALNIVGFPNCLDPQILGEILKGGADKVKEAGAVLVGGHSVQNEEPLYGLSVAGFVHPDKVFKNYGAKVGDVLILTKQIGSGVVNTAVKASVASEAATREAQTTMASLNKSAKEVIEKYPISACTDVTGFGLLGHLAEMATPSEVLCEVDSNAVCYMEDSLHYASLGLIPAGAYRNREYTQSEVMVEDGVGQAKLDLLYDPQTSGGLLISIPEKYTEQIMEDFAKKEMDTKVSVIGRVLDLADNKAHIRVI